MKFASRLTKTKVFFLLLITVFIFSTMTVIAAIPTLTVELEGGNSNTSNLRLYEQGVVTVTWNVNVTDFDDDDISFSYVDEDGNPIDFLTIDFWNPGGFGNQSIDRFFLNDSQIYTRDQKTHEFRIIAPNRKWHGGWRTITGEMIVTIREDAVDQGNTATSLTFTFGHKCTCRLTPEKYYLSHGQSMRISVDWLQSLTRKNKAKSLNDFFYSAAETGGGLSNLRPDPWFSRSQLVTLTAPATGSGTLVVGIHENVAPAGNDEGSIEIRYGP